MTAWHLLSTCQVVVLIHQNIYVPIVAVLAYTDWRSIQLLARLSRSVVLLFRVEFFGSSSPTSFGAQLPCIWGEIALHSEHSVFEFVTWQECVLKRCEPRDILRQCRQWRYKPNRTSRSFFHCSCFRSISVPEYEEHTTDPLFREAKEDSDHCSDTLDTPDINASSVMFQCLETVACSGSAVVYFLPNSGGMLNRVKGLWKVVYLLVGMRKAQYYPIKACVAPYRWLEALVEVRLQPFSKRAGIGLHKRLCRYWWRIGSNYLCTIELDASRIKQDKNRTEVNRFMSQIKPQNLYLQKC